MQDKNLQQADKTLRENWEKYRGRHVFVVGNEIFSAKSGEKAEEIYHQVKQKYPEHSPLMTYIPKKGSLILWS